MPQDGVGALNLVSTAAKQGGVLDGLVSLMTKKWLVSPDDAETGGAVPDDGGTGGGTELSKLGKKDLGADGAAAVQAKSIWLVSGATVTLNFLRKSMPRMGPATAACKNCEEKSLPWNWTVFLTNKIPKRGLVFHLPP
jgi:hypothetical protein